MRFYLALWIGKLARLASRILSKVLHKGGTNLPGQLALKICPDFLDKVAKPETVVAVTGTNGKTTLTNLLSDTLEKTGRKVLSNRLGSNINSGVATCLLTGVSLLNKEKYKLGVIEVDERSAFRVFPYLKPDYVVVTNLLRDSCRRNAHPHYIFDILNGGLKDNATLILNADDLISCFLKEGVNPNVLYGIAPQEGETAEERYLLNDMRICPECGHPLSYEVLRYNHIGRAYCEKCGFTSPKPDFEVQKLDLENRQLTVRYHGETEVYPAVSDSIFNLYDEIAGLALLRTMGLSEAQIRQALEGTHIVSTRFHEEDCGGVRLVGQMAKGQIAPALSVAFEYVSKRPAEKQLILILEDAREAATTSENMSYIYDADFEFLNKENIHRIVTVGKRSRDYYLRMLLAGIPEEKLQHKDTLASAAEAVDLIKGQEICVLYDNYQVPAQQKVFDMLKQRIAKEGAKDEN